MQEIMEINGVKYKRLEEGNKELKVGDVINYNNYKWYIMKLEENTATLVMKECLPENVIERYFKNYDDDKDVKFSIEDNYNWRKSNVRKGLSEFLYAEFNIAELELMQTNYNEEVNSFDRMRIPTRKEVENFTEKMHNISHSYGYWLMTPYGYYDIKNRKDARMFCVSGSYHPGNLSNGSVDGFYGVRPVVKINLETLKVENK